MQSVAPHLAPHLAQVIVVAVVVGCLGRKGVHGPGAVHDELVKVHARLQALEGEEEVTCAQTGVT